MPAEDPSDRIGSLVVDPGGPGGSAQDYAAGGSDVWGAALRDHFDIVGMDPRGVGASDPINCVSDVQEFFFVSGYTEIYTPAEVQTYEQQTVALGAGCIKNDPDLAALRQPSPVPGGGSRCSRPRPTGGRGTWPARC